METNSPGRSGLEKQDKRVVVSPVKQLLTRQRSLSALAEGATGND